MDPDDKVRASVCRIFSQLDYETALHHVSKLLLINMAGRGLDKKVGIRTFGRFSKLMRPQQIVRAEALGSIGKLFSLAYSEM